MKKTGIILVICVILIILAIGVFTYLNKSGNTKVSNSSESQIKSTDWSDYDVNEISLTDTLEITKAGIYKLTGTISDGLIKINTDGNVKLILNGVSITNSSGPTIYVENADNVEIETVGGTTNTLTDGKTYTGYEEDVDACIFSKDDLILSGNGTLKVVANYQDAIASKDDLKITGGTYDIKASDDAIRGKDSLEITDGKFTIDAGGDALKSTNETDANKGFILISGGEFNINSKSDGLDAISNIEINGGTFDITAREGIEGTYVKINDGTINISASDDGINASNKSNASQVKIEINGGNINIKMGAGDTDAIDSNGDILITGGVINITASSPFDYDGNAEHTGGTITVNGTTTNEITNQMMGGPQGSAPNEQTNMPNQGRQGGPQGRR